MTTTNPQAGVRPGAAAAQQKCSVCETEIVDDRPFCKIPHKEEPALLLCCPRCALRYFDTLHPATNGEELDQAAFERSVHFFVNGEKP
jgi:hypothetical protein